MAPTAIKSSPNNSVINDRNRELAIQHATVLQQRKDTEATILTALEELIDFPTHPDTIRTRPEATDVERFTYLIAPFQVSDYDALIEERNCAEKCGYVFCSKNLSRSIPSSNFSRIIRGEHSLKVVPNNKLEMWCDNWCARAAVFIKVQLSEVPAWERQEGAANKVTVLADQTSAELTGELKRNPTTRKDDKERKQLMAELAQERGDKAEHTRLPMVLPLRERPPTSVTSAHPPVQHEPEQQAQNIEGHVVRNPGMLVGKNGKPSADTDTDWDLG